jgi:hypothetical protein
MRGSIAIGLTESADKRYPDLSVSFVGFVAPFLRSGTSVDRDGAHRADVAHGHGAV